MSRNPNPKPRIIQAAGAELAFTTLCHWCSRPFVSVLRPFPVPYVCVACLLDVTSNLQVHSNQRDDDRRHESGPATRESPGP